MHHKLILLPSMIVETPITESPHNLPAKGVIEGAKVAALMATGYTGLFSLVNLLIQISDWLQGSGRVDIGMVILAGALAWIVGGIPASFIGMLAGRFIGAILHHTRKPLSLMGSFAVGVGVGVAILLIPTLLITRTLLESVVRGGDWIGLAIMWYLPCLFALLGLGWIAHRLNPLPRD